MAFLEIENLSLSISGRSILKNVNLTISKRETLGIVGESGSGKSLTALAILQLLPHGSVCSGRVALDGTNILALSERDRAALRGRSIGMIFQEPMTALNPVQSIGYQVAEGMRYHLRISRAEAEQRTQGLMEQVGLPPSKYSLDRFPHELSGGQRQRVVIAIAVALNPKLLIADEPTSALDVTTQAAILELLRELAHTHQSALMLISHDLAVVAKMSDQIAILQAGKVIEQGKTASTLNNLKQDYSKKLWAASRLQDQNYARKTKKTDKKLMCVDCVSRHYAKPKASFLSSRQYVKAVNQVSFDIYAGGRIGLVGESGCGKSTLARTILALEKPDNGKILFQGRDINMLPPVELSDLRAHMQIVFQDPYGSFNPRHKIGRLVAEPLHLLPNIGRAERYERVCDVLNNVGLPLDIIDRFPHEFSGGQRQRIAIARSIITEPKLIIADEPVSALDVSTRGQILDLLATLADQLGMAYLFISHDLQVVRAITDRVLVMKEGQIVEQGKTQKVFDSPRHAYTQALLKASLQLDVIMKQRAKDNENIKKF